MVYVVHKYAFVRNGTEEGKHECENLNIRLHTCTSDLTLIQENFCQYYQICLYVSLPTINSTSIVVEPRCDLHFHQSNCNFAINEESEVGNTDSGSIPESRTRFVNGLFSAEC